MTRIAIFCAALLGLSACGTPAEMAATANWLVFVGTHKTVIDLAASWATEEDCALVHVFAHPSMNANHEPYCQKPIADDRSEQMAIWSATLFCYRTLGGVSCYDRPDYTASSATRVDFAYGFEPPPAGRTVPARPEL